MLDAAFASLFFLCALTLVRAVIFASFSTGQTIMAHELKSCETKHDFLEFDPLRLYPTAPAPPATSSELSMGICDWHYLMPFRIAELFLSAGKTGLVHQMNAFLTQARGAALGQLAREIRLLPSPQWHWGVR